ncbi:pilus assembly PilX N-terminal domain-containing protein [Sporosarcina sp. ACRSM]|uniref:pilus assembly PilX N-terminal domain-containing protein n=1 Tax=Sporosarcina sp. ACRSM TaxID=2918216 RepID=UPI001EF70573|nr:pilus assembly PilX N-terminal domain-containing protein [Sporosarcina sp. ACRSM]MCG7336997.1 pilus assembly PilX N-terminal domain-containing protein [Sporosarcina sp. ACRSM]
MRYYESIGFSIKNNRGFTLVGVLMVLVVLSIIGVSIITVASNSLKISSSEHDDQSVFYIAEAGATDRLYKIEGNVKQAFETINDQYSSLNAVEKRLFNFEERFYTEVKSKMDTKLKKMNVFEMSFGEQPQAEVIVIPVKTDGPLEYKIESTGNIGQKTRTVIQEIIITLDPPEIKDPPSNPIDYPEGIGVYIKENISLNSAIISGNIGILNAGANSITIGDGGVVGPGWSKFTGSIYVPIGSEGIAVKKPTWMSGIPSAKGMEMRGFPGLPAFPKIPTYPRLNGYSFSTNLGGDGSKLAGNTLMILNQNSSLGTLKVGGSHQLIIDVGGTDRELVLDELDVSGHADIIIKGTGKLTLYVKNKFTIAGSATLNAQAPNGKLEIYFGGSNLHFNSDTRIYGSIFAEKANISVGGSDAIYGSILSGGSSFIVEGGGNIQPSLYFAPNAHFEVRSSGKVYGVIIGKSINVSGNGEVRYQKPFEDDFASDTGDNSGENNTSGFDSFHLKKGDLIESE